MIRRLTSFVLVLVAAVSFGFVQTAEAKTNGLSIGPFLQEVTITREQSEASFLITLTNSTTVPLPLLVSVVDFGAADENGGVNFLSTTDGLERKYGLASWMKPEKDKLTLAPKSSQRIKVTIENRETLGPGGHYGAVIFKLDKSQEFENQSKVDFTKAVSTLVLAKKLGGEKQSVTLSGVTWDGAPFALPTEIRAKVFNNGNVHATPKGDVTLTDTLGRVVSRDRLNSGNTIILPETIRIYPVQLSHSPVQWLPGWSTLTVRYKINETDNYQTIVNRIFIVPVVSIIALVIAIIAVILGIRFRKQLRKLVVKTLSRIKHRHKRNKTE